MKKNILTVIISALLAIGYSSSALAQDKVYSVEQWIESSAKDTIRYVFTGEYQMPKGLSEEVEQAYIQEIQAQNITPDPDPNVRGQTNALINCTPKPVEGSENLFVFPSHVMDGQRKWDRRFSAYNLVEIQETGNPDEQKAYKITKWVSVPLKLKNARQMIGCYQPYDAERAQVVNLYETQEGSNFILYEVPFE